MFAAEQDLFFLTVFSSSRGEPVASVVVRCFTEALPENRYLIFLLLHLCVISNVRLILTMFLDVSLVIDLADFFTNACLKRLRSSPSRLTWI